MLFNSLSFLIFFPAVTIAYFSISNLRWRVVFLVVASYMFYMGWNASYLLLIVTSTLVDYWVGLRMQNTTDAKWRKVYLLISLSVNLGLLFTFKYLNFFLDSVNTLFSFVEIPYQFSSVGLLLPVGISFYTFQTLSYSIDVYRGKIAAERNLGAFAAYVSFFPQLVAGPIERATTLLPQFHIKHVFKEERFISGGQIILWGFFKKIVIADRLAVIVNQVYSDPESYSSLSLLIATYFFAFQIYCDFSGYSDIAIGTAKILGFDLMQNFDRPYFSKSVREFWARWHISLSTWFRDYLYIPLGGNRVGKAHWYFNLMVVFLISGLWHGANWTFVIWGALHGAYIVLSNIWASYGERLGNKFNVNGNSRLNNGIRIFVTFHLVLFAWVFFRANTLSDALYIAQSFLIWGEGSLELGINSNLILLGSVLITILLAVQVWQGNKSISGKLSQIPVSQRWALYYLVIFMMLFMGVFSSDLQFIYFQF